MLETDKILWVQFIEGNSTSLEQLMQSYYRLLFNYGKKFNDDNELIKDCIQDLFLNLWSKRDTINRSVNVKAYLFASLRRQLHRKLSSESTAAVIAFDARENYSFNLQLSIEQQYILNETANFLTENIVKAVSNLPVRQKEVIYLKFFLCFRRDEIANAMSISPQTVSNLLQIALKKLKDTIKGQFSILLLVLIIPILIKESFF